MSMQLNDLTKPVKVRLSNAMIGMCVLFTLFELIIVYGIYFISTNTIYMEDDTPIPVFMKVFIIAAEVVVGTGILFIVVPMWKRVFRDGAMTLTQDGIENTFMIFTVLAFWTTLRIRIIPWSALTISEDDKDRYRVDVSKLPHGSVGVVAKFILRITGFCFSIGKIKKAEIERYRQTALANKNQ